MFFFAKKLLYGIREFQIFVAIAFALEPPYHDVTFSINLEGNYVLPMNDTEFTYPPVVSRRSWQRQFFYNILESNIKS